STKLSPGVRVPRKEREIQKIPMNEIRQFLNKPQIVSEDYLLSAPYIVASADERILMSQGNTVYVRNFEDEGYERYKILRPGQIYRDGPDGDALAREAVYLGEARLEAEGDPATFNIIAAEREIRSGARLLPVDERGFEDDFIPFAPEEVDEDARIIAVVDGVSQIGQNNIVVINKGENDAMERGHILSVYRGGDIVRDNFSGKTDEVVKLPALRAGTLMIFKTFEKVSFALVLQSNRAMFVNDAVDLP
ncbi:MAG: peptidoglycan-binding protein, partial [Pseudomonadota bacterium]